MANNFDIIAAGATRTLKTTETASVHVPHHIIESGTVNATLAAETTKIIGTVNVAAGQTIAVTNTGTFATQATLAAETTKVIGTVNIAAGQSVGVTGSVTATGPLTDTELRTTPVNVAVTSVPAYYAEDSAAAGGHGGLFVLAVRNDTPGSLVGTDGDYAAFQLDSTGRLRVAPVEAQLVHDLETDLALGDITGYAVHGKFGRGTCDSTQRDLWALGSTTAYPWPQAATTVRIKSGGNVNDTAAGTGARKITVAGLDQNWNEASEDIVTAGASASSSTTTTFIRIFRAYVTDVGTYGEANTGNIDVENTAGTATLCRIAAGEGQTTMTMYTVPAGYTAALKSVRICVEGTKLPTVKMWQRRNADDVSAPFTGKRMVRDWPSVTATIVAEFKALPTFPAKTDLWFTGQTSSSTAVVSVGYDMILET